MAGTAFGRGVVSDVPPSPCAARPRAPSSFALIAIGSSRPDFCCYLSPLMLTCLSHIGCFERMPAVSSYSDGEMDSYLGGIRDTCVTVFPDPDPYDMSDTVVYYTSDYGGGEYAQSPPGSYTPVYGPSDYLSEMEACGRQDKCRVGKAFSVSLEDYCIHAAIFLSFPLNVKSAFVPIPADHRTSGKLLHPRRPDGRRNRGQGPNEWQPRVVELHNCLLDLGVPLQWIGQPRNVP